MHINQAAGATGIRKFSLDTTTRSIGSGPASLSPTETTATALTNNDSHSGGTSISYTDPWNQLSEKLAQAKVSTELDVSNHGTRMNANVPAFLPSTTYRSLSNEITNLAEPLPASRATWTRHAGPDIKSLFIPPPGVESRQIIVCGLEGDFVHHGGFVALLDKLHLTASMISNVIKQERDGRFAVFIKFDDFHTAEHAKKLLRGHLGFNSVHTINDHDYFTHDSLPHRAHAISECSGEIFAIATYDGSIQEYRFDKVVSDVHNYLQSFGDIRKSELQSESTMSSFIFRVEFSSVSAAQKAIDTVRVQTKITPDVLLTVRDSANAKSVRYPHPPVQSHACTPQRLMSDRVGLGPQQRLMSDRIGLGPQDPRTPIHTGFPTPPPSIDRMPARSMHTGGGGKHNQSVSIRSIESGRDVRTTIMIRNIPNRLTAPEFKAWLDRHSLGCYTFSYLRIDFSTGNNVGYAFVDFATPDLIIPFLQARVGRPWGTHHSEKLVDVSYATIQGQDCLIAKFRNSSVMKESDYNRPKLFFTVYCDDIPDGMKIGDERPFPLCDNQTKFNRSVDNAATLGLFAPRGADGNADRRHRSRFDRGTPSAELDEQRLLSRGRDKKPLYIQPAPIGQAPLPRSPGWNQLPGLRWRPKNSDDDGSDKSSDGYGHGKGPARRHNYGPHGRHNY